jgi:hypothetical protein
MTHTLTGSATVERSEGEASSPGLQTLFLVATLCRLLFFWVSYF